MSDCIFCKIVSGEIQSVKVYEDADLEAFLDINPVRPGHTLLVPKVHSDRFDRMEPAQAGKLFEIVRKLAPAVAAAFGVDSFNASVNSGLAAGQVVFHTHVHIIPRGSAEELSHWPRGAYQGSEAEAVGQKIRAALRGAI